MLSPSAQSFVSYSFEDEFSTINTNINGTHYILLPLRNVHRIVNSTLPHRVRCLGMLKNLHKMRIHHLTRSSYGISKVAGFHLTKNYRESYNLYALSGILFNHESPRRGFEYVTRKVTNTVAKIKLGLAKELRLGNLEAKRDWGYSGDYVKAMWLMLQQDKPDDYVIATGEVHSVKELVETAFGYVDLGWKEYVVIDDKFYRPAEIHELRGDFSKARGKLRWEPTVNFKELIELMVDADLRALTSQATNMSGK